MKSKRSIIIALSLAVVVAIISFITINKKDYVKNTSSTVVNTPDSFTNTLITDSQAISSTINDSQLIKSTINDSGFVNTKSEKTVADKSEKVTAKTNKYTTVPKKPVSFKKAPMAKTEWMREVKYGVLVHYLEQLQNGKNPWRQGKRTNWDACVTNFNVNTFAEQMHDIGAGYVIFSVYQASKFLCLPNETYEQFTGYKKGEATSNRDLPADLYAALSKYNIKLMLYVTGDGTYADSVGNTAMQNPQLQLKQNRNKFIVTPIFVNNWSKVLRDISMRYGSKVSGWWVDGSYNFHGYNDALIKQLHDALKAGNPDCVTAFNPGPRAKVTYYSKWDDYTAGEMYKLNDLPPQGGLINGIQWHEVTFLGNNWKQPGVRFSADSLINYINQVNAIGGVITFDVCTLRDGSIDPTQYNFMKQVNEKVRR